MARRIVAALLVLVSCLLAPLALGGYWAERTITDNAAFNETLAPLADDPLVRQTIATEATSAIVEAVDAQGRATKALGALTGPLSGIRPDDSVIASAIASGVNDAIASGVDAYVNSERFGDAWQVVSSELQKGVVGLIDRDTSDAAIALVDGQIVLNTKLALDKVQTELVKRDIPFAGSLDIPGRDVVLADTPNLQLTADALAVFLPVASWLWIVVLAMLIAGVLLWRPRARGLLWAGLGLAAGAALTYAVLDLGSAALVSTAPQGFGSLVSLVISTLLRFLINALLVMLALGVALALAGWLAGATRSGRAVRLAITGVALRWGRPMGDSALGRFTAEHPMFVPTLRALVIAAAVVSLIVQTRLSPATVAWTAVVVAAALLVVEVVEGAGRGHDRDQSGALVAPAAPVYEPPVP